MTRPPLALLLAAMAGGLTIAERAHAQAGVVSVHGVAFDSLRSAPLRGEGGRFTVAARNARVGYCMASLYVDGRWERDQEELHWLRTDDIATVEVYPRASMTPAEFVPPTRERCGAVVIWTKHTFR